MTVYHVVLFKLKPGVSRDAIAKLEATGQEMVGQVPGLSRIDFGPPLASTAERTKPYDYGLVAVLDKPEQVATYAAHPAHQKVHHERLAVGDESVGTLAYDLEIP